MAATVRRDDQASRYEAIVGSAVAGYLSFYSHQGRLVLDLTRVDDTFAGHGIAGQLVRNALEDARGRGLLVVPVCPYVSGWLDRNPEYQDLVDHEMLAQIEAGS